jgi:CRP/FNR family transcriptional regulator
MPFSVLTEEDLHSILLPINNFQIPTGTEIVAANGLVKSIHTIRRGYVKLQQASPNGRHRIVRLLGAGEVVGLEVLTEHRYRHSAQALTEVDLCEVSPRSITPDRSASAGIAHQFA